ALLFQGVRRATPWFVAFVAATVASGALDPGLHGDGHVPTSIVIAFFVLNLLGVSTTVYLLLRYFIGERERVLHALRVEQGRSERLLLNILPAAVDRFRAEAGVELAIRVGIDSGPVVAGVIGHRKFSYDIWGDTVNMASRMEAQGLPACIQVTHNVYEQLRGRYEFRERGTVDVK